jgi:hypothetical protein
MSIIEHGIHTPSQDVPNVSRPVITIDALNANSKEKKPKSSLKTNTESQLPLQ